MPHQLDKEGQVLAAVATESTAGCLESFVVGFTVYQARFLQGAQGQVFKDWLLFNFYHRLALSYLVGAWLTKTPFVTRRLT